MTDIRVDRVRIEAMLTLRGMNHQALADKMDVHINGVKRILREQSTSIAGLERLCGALQCHPFDLIVAEGYPEPFSVAPAYR